MSGSKGGLIKDAGCNITPSTTVYKKGCGCGGKKCITDHGMLKGLGDNDHPQYLLVANFDEIISGYYSSNDIDSLLQNNYYTSTQIDQIIAGVGGIDAEGAQDAVGTILVDTNTIDFTYNDGTPSITADVKYQMSITADTSGLKFVNDVDSPSEQYHYGTNYNTASKGWIQNFLLRDSGRNIWASNFVTQLSKNISGGSADGIYIGQSAASSLTTGNKNTIIGHGLNASNITSASQVTVYGFGNLLASTASNIVAVGNNLNTTSVSGTDLVLIGRNNLQAVHTAVDIVVAGSSSLNNYTGSLGSIVSLGKSNLVALTTGYAVVAIGGSLAAKNLTTGNNSVFIGTESGSGVTTGINNYVIGDYTGLSSSSSRNVIIGGGAGASGTYSSTVASSNVLIGNGSVAGGAYSFSVAIGSDSYLTANNQCTIGGSRGAEQITDFIFGGPSRRQNGNPDSSGDDGATKNFMWRIPERYNATNATNLAGHKLIIRGSLGTGTGGGGDIAFETLNLTSGSTLNTAVERLLIMGDTGNIKVSSYLNTRNDIATPQVNMLATDSSGVLLSYLCSQDQYTSTLTPAIGETATFLNAMYVRLGNVVFVTLVFDYQSSSPGVGTQTVDFTLPVSPGSFADQNSLIGSATADAYTGNSGISVSANVGSDTGRVYVSGVSSSSPTTRISLSFSYKIS